MPRPHGIQWEVSFSSFPWVRAFPSFAWEVRQNYLLFRFDASSWSWTQPLSQTAQRHSHHPPPNTSTAMASRRLALNLSQGVRSRAGLVVPRRGLATPHHAAPGIKTQTTTLKNGLTVSSPPTSPRCLAINWPLRPPFRPLRHHANLNCPSRSRPSTRPTRRRRPSACGSTPVPEPRPKRQTAPRTS